MSDYNIENKNNTEELKKSFLKEKLQAIFKEKNITTNRQEVNRKINKLMNEINNGPIFQGKKINRNEVPYKEDFKGNMEGIKKDLEILNNEIDKHAEFIKNSFNSVYTEKERINKRIDRLNSLTGDLFLITNRKNDNVHYITESFNDANALDETFSVDSISKSSIQTKEGILTLERTSSKNLSEGARIAHISGNGDMGMNHLARKYTSVDTRGNATEEYRFLNESNKEQHMGAENILDDKPDTLFEYQLVNVPNEFKKSRNYYDFDWANGKEQGEKLRLKIIIELPKEQYINWLTLMPYYPNNSTGELIVHSIRTSINGFDYEPLYKKTVLNEKLNITPQTYRLDDIFTGKTEADEGFYQGKGVWSFPERKARLVEVIIDQEESYKETLGQEVYYLTLNNGNRVQVEEPEELKNSNPGKYMRQLNGEPAEYVKEIQATREGWRYSIGIRDINIMQFQFNEQSEFISKRYELPRNIRKLNLYAKEIIPESYLNIVNINNDWIRYEVSFDDVNWHRISPMHHEPLSENFPPKIIELNKALVDLNNAFQVHKKIIKNEEAKHLRFRVSMKRPKGQGFEATTPILEEVAFKVEMEDEL